MDRRILADFSAAKISTNLAFGHKHVHQLEVCIDPPNNNPPASGTSTSITFCESCNLGLVDRPADIWIWTLKLVIYNE
jgi:hypothetical protein